MNPSDTRSAQTQRRRPGFSEDFSRFFLRGLAALTPTLITLWLLVRGWKFLWENLGQYILDVLVWLWNAATQSGPVRFHRPLYVHWYVTLNLPEWQRQLLGVLLAILLVYIVGLFVGNLIGRTIWRLAEMAVMRVPLIRAIYPAVKQVTDFVLADRRQQQFQPSSVVAVQPHAQGIWSIGLVTGAGLPALSEKAGEEMVTVFVPSSPTAFSGYVLVVPRRSLVQLPMKVEEAMRLLVSGGVINPPVPGAVGPPTRPAPPAGVLPATPPLRETETVGFTDQ